MTHTRYSIVSVRHGSGVFTSTKAVYPLVRAVTSVPQDTCIITRQNQRASLFQKSIFPHISNVFLQQTIICRRFYWGVFQHRFTQVLSHLLYAVHPHTTTKNTLYFNNQKIPTPPTKSAISHTIINNRHTYRKFPLSSLTILIHTTNFSSV